MATQVMVTEKSIRDTLIAFGGPPGESKADKNTRYSRQITLSREWPELHEALMNMIGLDKRGHRLDIPQHDKTN